MLLLLQPSRIELGVVSSCHFFALIALFMIELDIALRVIVALLIAGSMLAYVLQATNEGVRGWSGKGWREVARHLQFRPGLSIMLGQQHGVLYFATQEITVHLPHIQYYSEFLIVLRFEPELVPVVSQGSQRWRRTFICVAIWPDSLNRADIRRLRRYLRFDCPQISV